MCTESTVAPKKTTGILTGRDGSVKTRTPNTEQSVESLSKTKLVALVTVVTVVILFAGVLFIKKLSKKLSYTAIRQSTASNTLLRRKITRTGVLNIGAKLDDNTQHEAMIV